MQIKRYSRGVKILPPTPPPPHQPPFWTTWNIRSQKMLNKTQQRKHFGQEKYMYVNHKDPHYHGWRWYQLSSFHHRDTIHAKFIDF